MAVSAPVWLSNSHLSCLFNPYTYRNVTTPVCSIRLHSVTADSSSDLCLLQGAEMLGRCITGPGELTFRVFVMLKKWINHFTALPFFL